MNEIVGNYDIVFLTLDTLRYDVAQKELQEGRLPNLSRHITAWEKRHTPGSFTYAAHQAFFAGFLPTPVDNPTAPRLLAVDFPGSTSISSDKTKCFNSPNIVEGLAKEGYLTICIGGVGFFNPEFPLGNVLPNLFQERYWSRKLGVTDINSTENQIALACKKLEQTSTDQRIFLFINISAMHQPNYFYNKNHENNIDNIASHAAALNYVDSQLPLLFDTCKKRCNTLFILCSDHGTCYGEEGYSGHRLAHEVVWQVPYANFIQETA